MSDEQSIHFLFPGNILMEDYNQPFNYYPCTLTKRKDKWFLISNEWLQILDALIDNSTSEELSASGSRRKAGSATIFPETSSFESNLLEFLCDLLDKDLGIQKKVMQDCITRYDTIVQGKANHNKEIRTILFDLQTTWHQIHPYFVFLCRDLLRDELTSHFHNNYFTLLEQKGEIISITSSFFNSYIKELTNYITPFMKEIFCYDNNSIEIYIEKLKRYLLIWIANCRYIIEIYLPSPTQVIYDSINFLDVSCDFLNRHRDDLSVLSDSDRLSICVKIFATNQLKDSYNDFILTNSMAKKEYSTFSINEIPLYMRPGFQKDMKTNLDRIVSMTVSNKLEANNIKEYRCNFQSIVFITLREMLSSTDTEEDGKTEKKNTFILKCKYCGKHFIQPRANSLYCSRIVKKYKKTCSEVGPKIKYSENMSLAEKARHKIVNRFSTNIKRAGGNTGRMRTLTRNREEWNKMEEECRKQLEDGEITAEEYIEKIENAYKEICKST